MSLKIGVFIKHVPKTTTVIQLKGDAIDESDIKYEINAYDEFAIEEAVKTKDAWLKAGQQVEVVGICLGPTTATKTLRDAFAVGVDRGILIVDNDKKAIDPRSVSSALAAVCKEEAFHIIFAGKQAVDTDSHAVAQMVAEKLGLPHIGPISKIEFTGTSEAKVDRDIEGGVKETYQIKFPAVLIANKGLNKMRLASLPGIRAAAAKPLKEVPLTETKIGYRTAQWSLPPERGKVKMIEGEAAQQAAELVKLLREEAKVI